MKTYVLTLSQVFPVTHSKAGEPTNFEAAFNASSSEPPYNAGQETRNGNPFPEFVKLHTIRANYDLWAKRFAEIERGEARLAIRQWTGRPYNSKQKELAILKREDGIGIEKLWFDRENLYCPMITTDTFNYSQVPLHLANNDGLSFEDWEEWFKGYDLSKPLAVIHFTKFRYAK